MGARSVLLWWFASIVLLVPVVQVSLWFRIRKRNGLADGYRNIKHWFQWGLGVWHFVSQRSALFARCFDSSSQCFTCFPTTFPSHAFPNPKTYPINNLVVSMVIKCSLFECLCFTRVSKCPSPNPPLPTSPGTSKCVSLFG